MRIHAIAFVGQNHTRGMTLWIDCPEYNLLISVRPNGTSNLESAPPRIAGMGLVAERRLLYAHTGNPPVDRSWFNQTTHHHATDRIASVPFAQTPSRR